MNVYHYGTEKQKLFTDQGQKDFLKIRDKAHSLLKTAGAFRAQELFSGLSGEMWTMMACLDRLVELNEIVEIERSCWAQYRVYSTTQTSNR